MDVSGDERRVRTLRRGEGYVTVVERTPAPWTPRGSIRPSRLRSWSAGRRRGRSAPRPSRLVRAYQARAGESEGRGTIERAPVVHAAWKDGAADRDGVEFAARDVLKGATCLWGDEFMPRPN